jgi:hypothetical protein
VDGVDAWGKAGGEGHEGGGGGAWHGVGVNGPRAEGKEAAQVGPAPKTGP